MSNLSAILMREIQLAVGYNTDVVAAKSNAALNQYHGRMTAPAEGRSAAVSLDLSDGLHSAMAQICPVVRSSEVSFDAQSQEDESQAQTETDFVRAAIERASGYQIVDQSIFDALLLGTGWIYAGVDEGSTQTTHTYPGILSVEEQASLKEGAPDTVALQFTTRGGQTIVTATTTVKKLVVECVAPEDMLFSEQGSDFNVNEIRFVGRRRLYTVAALVEMGINADDVRRIPDYYGDLPDVARLGAQQDQTNMQSAQEANQLKMVYCCYLRVASSESSNTVELRKLWIGSSGGELLLDEPAEYIPYIAGSAIPMPHRILGQSFYDLLGPIQTAKTEVLRQYLDNLNVLNGSRVGVVEGQVELTDLTSGRLNGIVRCKSPQSIWQLPAADIGAQVLQGLNYLDHVVVQRIGSSVDFNDVQAQIMGNSATAAAGQLARVELMAGWFAGNLVRTMMLPLYLLVHRLLRTELGGPVSAKIKGKWAQTDPSQWHAREVTSISMGMTTTEKAERLQALTAVLQQQQALLTSGLGGILTDMSRYHNVLSDWIRTSGLGVADKYVIDPSSPEAVQVQQQQAQAQEQAKEDLLTIQEYLMKMEQAHKLEIQRRDLEFRTYQEQVKLEIEEAKLTSSSVIEVAKLNKPEKEPDDSS